MPMYCILRQASSTLFLIGVRNDTNRQSASPIRSVTICSSCGKKEERGELKRIWYNGSYNRDFKDLNDVHLAEAKRIGIKPASNREEAEKVKKEMEEIETNEYYEVEKLTYSIPYLIPSAAQLLEDSGIISRIPYAI